MKKHLILAVMAVVVSAQNADAGTRILISKVDKAVETDVIVVSEDAQGVKFQRCRKDGPQICVPIGTGPYSREDLNSQRRLATAKITVVTIVAAGVAYGAGAFAGVALLTDVLGTAGGAGAIGAITGLGTSLSYSTPLTRLDQIQYLSAPADTESVVQIEFKGSIYALENVLISELKSIDEDKARRDFFNDKKNHELSEKLLQNNGARF